MMEDELVKLGSRCSRTNKVSLSTHLEDIGGASGVSFVAAFSKGVQSYLSYLLRR